MCCIDWLKSPPNAVIPFRTFKFQVLIENQPVTGLRKMTALKKATEVAIWRYGGDPSDERKLPDGSKHETVTLELGLSHDPLFGVWEPLLYDVSQFMGQQPLPLRRTRRLAIRGKIDVPLTSECLGVAGPAARRPAAWLPSRLSGPDLLTRGAAGEDASGFVFCLPLHLFSALWQASEVGPKRKSHLVIMDTKWR